MDIFSNDLLVCNFCGKRDVAFPVNNIYICPRCLKVGYWEWKDIKVYRSGYCDLCGVHAQGAIAHISQAKACWRCLWSKVSRKKGALRIAGTRLV